MDEDDPVVAEKDVPSFNVVQEKIKEIDNTVIIFRVYYFFTTRIFRFQLMKKDKMCMIEISRNLLESLGKDGMSADHELSKLLDINIESTECWRDFEV